MVSINNILSESISSEKKFGEGRYRAVYRIDDKVLKLLKPTIKKNYGLFSINFPLEQYVKLKFGIQDFNQFELDNYDNFIRKVPDEFKENFAEIYWAGRYNGISASISELVLNGDETISQNLSETKKIEDITFWKKINQIEEILLSNEIFITGIQGENIVVKTTQDCQTPIFIDYKRFGDKTYPFQPWLHSKKQLTAKIKRKFDKLRETYQC